MTTGRWPMSLERAVTLLTLATDAVLAGDGAVIDDDIRPELRLAVKTVMQWLRGLEARNDRQWRNHASDEAIHRGVVDITQRPVSM
jgi:hypothetical protein